MRPGASCRRRLAVSHIGFCHRSYHRPVFRRRRGGRATRRSSKSASDGALQVKDLLCFRPRRADKRKQRWPRAEAYLRPGRCWPYAERTATGVLLGATCAGEFRSGDDVVSAPFDNRTPPATEPAPPTRFIYLTSGLLLALCSLLPPFKLHLQFLFAL